MGEGPQREALRAELRGCDLVRFVEPVAYDQVPGLLQNFDVFVLLSDFEGLPLSLLEAMGAGVVPVVSDLPGVMAEVVDDSRGVRVPVGDVEGAAAAVEALARDRARLESCARAGAEFVRARFSADGMADHYCRVVEEAGRGKCAWPSTVPVPRPLGVTPGWWHEGAPRVLRRWLGR